MSLQSPEIIEPKPEIVLLNQEFQLFEPSSTKTDAPRHPDDFTTRKVILKSDILPDMRFEPTIHVSSERRFSTLIPSRPKSGHRIIQEDFNTEERIKKINEDPKNSEYVKTPMLELYAFGDLGDLTKKPLSTEELALMERLRLHISLPTGSFEGKPDLEFFAGLPTTLAEVVFRGFYPLDTGPAALIDSILFLQDSFSLGVEPKDLQKIRAKFVLAPEGTKRR